MVATTRKARGNGKRKARQAAETVRFNGKRHLDKVIPVRISADKWEQIRQEAIELGVGSATPARIWILDGLRRQRSGVAAENE
jgi:hypothetical protein